jgi:hypothetical protein
LIVDAGTPLCRDSSPIRIKPPVFDDDFDVEDGDFDLGAFAFAWAFDPLRSTAAGTGRDAGGFLRAFMAFS